MSYPLLLYTIVVHQEKTCLPTAACMGRMVGMTRRDSREEIMRSLRNLLHPPVGDSVHEETMARLEKVLSDLKVRT